MKTLIYIMALVLTTGIICAQSKVAALDEKNGFKSTQLGSKFEDFQNLEKVEDDGRYYSPYDYILEMRRPESNDPFYQYVKTNLVEYYDRSITLSFGNYPLRNVRYLFYQNVLIAIILRLQNSTDDYNVKYFLDSIYGYASACEDRYEQTYWKWEGNTVEMRLYKTSDFWHIYWSPIIISSKPLMEWKNKELKQKEIEWNSIKGNDL